MQNDPQEIPVPESVINQGTTTEEISIGEYNQQDAVPAEKGEEVTVSEEFLSASSYVDDVNQKIENVNNEIRKEYDLLVGNEYPTEQEKEQRIDEIDTTIRRLIDELDTYEEKTSIRGLRAVKEEIQKLSNEKKALQDKINPPTAAEIKKFEEGFGIFNGVKDAELLEEYGPYRAKKIYNEAINKKLDILSKERSTEATPSSIMSFDNVVNGKKPKLPGGVSESDLDNIWSKATKNKEYQRGDYAKKRDLLYKAAKEQISDREGIEDKETAALNILGNLLPRFAHTDDGNLTIEGTKLYAEYMHNRLTDLIDFHLSAMSPEMMVTTDLSTNKAIDRFLAQEDTERYNRDLYNDTFSGLTRKEINEKFGKENHRQWYNTLMDDLRQLMLAKNQIEDILEIPEARNRISDVGKGIKSVDARDLAIGIPQMADALNITGITKKIQKGEALTLPEEMTMNAYATIGYAKNFDTEGTWFKASKGAVEMIPYIAEFVMTGGVYSTVKSAALKSVAPLTRKLISSQTGKFATRVADLTALNIARAGGAAAQAAALPQMYIKNTAENIRPDVVLDPQMDEISFALVENTGDDLVKGATKGYLSTFAEMAFERSGAYLMKAIPGAGKAAQFARSKITGKQFVERKILDDFMKIKGIKKVTDLSDEILNKKLGWDGILEEYLEEVGTYFTEKAIQGEPAIGEDFWEDQLTTLMTVAMFGAPMRLGNIVNSYAVGNNVQFDVKDSETGEIKKVGIPQKVWNDLSKLLNDGKDYLDHNGFADLMDKHGESLDKEQFNLLMNLTSNEGRRRIQKTVTEKSPFKKKYEEPVEDFDPNIFEEKPEITEEQQSDIEKVNQDILKRHSKLAANDLLIEDTSGQYLEPTKSVIDQQHKIYTQQWADLAEVDEFGNVTNMSPELNRLEEQINVLEEYQDKYHNEDVPYQDLTADQKHKRLEIDLERGDDLKGTASFVTDRFFQVSLNDGRKVGAFYIKNLDKATREKAFKAIRNNEPVSLELESWQIWNPDLNIGRKVVTEEGEETIPFFDRIQVRLADGTPIGAVQITDYNEERRKKRDLERREEEIKQNLSNSAAEFFQGLTTKFGGLQQIVSDQDKDQLGKQFVQMIKDAGDWSGIQLEKLLDKIIEFIRSLENINDEQKGYLIALARENEDAIIKSVADQQLAEKGFVKKPKELSLDELVVPEIHGIAPSGSVKVDALLQGYAPVWRNIADQIDSSKDNVEKTFYRIAKQEGVLSNLQNEGLFSHFLGTLYGTDQVTDAIVDMLRKSSLDAAVSLFNNYNNLYLAKQYGYIVQNGKFIRRLLNPSERYDEFRDRFFNQVKHYGLEGYVGFDAIKRRLQKHVDEMNQRFHNKNQSWSWYDNQTPEKREELRREQHNNDVSLLSEITGIPVDIWEQYFVQRTGETMAKTSKDARNEAEFGTYDNLLKHDTWRGNHRRIQSDLAFNLWFQTLKKAPSLDLTFEEAFIKFFTKGDEATGTLSNLYKLSTAIETSDEIGMSGVDIKSDRFNSFVQSSNLQDIASNIQKSNIDNHIVDYYRSEGKNMEIGFINGIHNLDKNRDQKGTHNVNMSNEDIWLTQLMLFIEEGPTYQHWVGQFGDKPALTVVEVPKIENPSAKEIESIRKRFPGFDDAVQWFYENYVEYNQSFFSPLYSSLPPEDQNKQSARRQVRKDLATSFIYNFARNISATSELFFGDNTQYTDLTDMVKRAGSTNSPGYRLNQYIEGGVGPTYQFALVDDNIEGIEVFDGVEFMSGEYSVRTQKSMGLGFSKADQEGFEVLSSVKALTSFINPDNNLRGLTKTNRLNIEILANAFPGSKFEQIRNFMNKNGIDVLSFTSGTKKYEHAKNKKDLMGSAVKLWGKDGALIKNPQIPSTGIVTRQTRDVYIQQDLRHPSKPKATKMPSQLLANMLILDNGPAVSSLMSELQVKLMNEMVREFKGKPMDQIKLKWLKQEVNQYTQPDLYNLLQAGMTPYEPAMANFMRKILAGTVTRKALEIPINRLTTQEIPDPDGLLEGRRRWKGTYATEEKEWTADVILLPDIAANVYGARYENTDYEGKIDDALEFVLKTRKQHRDLFDPSGNIMWWEIVGRNGVIPGELVISTRVPADDLHSHTVGRLKHKVHTGNFTMLDRESQLASGSDFDGDQRFNQVFYKDSNGGILFDDSKEGIANQIMRAIANDYSNPVFDNKIKAAIDKDQYDYIVDRYRKDEPKYGMMDPRGWDKARNENMVGVKMKGILTDAVTIYGLLAPRDIRFKQRIQLKIGEKKRRSTTSEKETIGLITGEVPEQVSEPVYINLTGFVNDPKGLMKLHLANFLNLAFDNAADPRIETIGVNEITANMFVIALLGNRDVDTTNNESILKHIEDIIQYFTSDIVRDFTREMRRDNGGMRSVDMKSLSDRMAKKYSRDDVKQVLKFYALANEIPKLRRFYNLTQKASGSSIELETDKALFSAVRYNKKDDFRLINVRDLFYNDRPITEFAASEMSLDLAEKYIYADSFYHTPTGRQIRHALLAQFPDKKTFTEGEMKSIDYAMSNIAALRALGVKKPVVSLQNELVNDLEKYREKYPGNKFLEAIQNVKHGTEFNIEIAPDYRRRKINEQNLEKIRDHFDALPSAIQDKFMAHALYQWGATTSTFGGSYYSLIGPDYRVDLSKKAQNELYEWQLDNLSSVDKLQIMNWIIRGSRIKEFRNKSNIANPAYANYYDYNSLSVLETPVSYEGLETLTGVTNANEYIEFAEQNNFNASSLRDELNKMYGVQIKSVTRELIPTVERLLKDYRRKAKLLFPPASSSDVEVRDMLPGDSISEALASEDPELQGYVFNWLKKTYPEVRFFADRDAFYEFVRKNGGRGLNVSPYAIGHAFQNAIFVDPAKAVQSTIQHELSHIYWDALPEDHKIKSKLLDIYREQFPEYNPDRLEEAIILDISRAGYKLADVELRGGLKQRFLDSLKEFWAAIKQFFGVYSKKDLVRQMAKDIWTNEDNISPSTSQGNMIVKSMISYNFRKENAPMFRGDTHTHYIGGSPVPSVTSVIRMEMSEQFDPEVKAQATTVKEEQIYRRSFRETWTEEEKRVESQALLELWMEDTVEKGTFVHAIAESVFSNKPVSEEDINSHFEDRSVYERLRQDFIQMREDILDQYPNAVFYAEPHLISKKFQIGGFADLVVDVGNNQLIVYDFKTTEKQFATDDGKPVPDYKKSYGTFKAPFHNTPNSKYTQHMLQLNMYSNILEEQKNNRNPEAKNTVLRTRIIPVVKESNSDHKIVKARIGNWVSVPRNEKTTRLADDMMKLSRVRRAKTEKIYPEFESNLRSQGHPGYLIKDMLTAYHFMNVYSQDITNFNKDEVGDIRHKGILSLRSKLIASEDAGGLGYALSEIEGPTAYGSEELFFIAMNNIKKSRYTEEQRDEYFPEQEVSARYKPIPNPKRSKRKWHRLGDKLLHEVGLKNLKAGDEIIITREVKFPSGRQPINIYYYEVQKIDLKKKRIFARNEETGEDNWIPAPSLTDGIYKQEANVPEGIEDPGKESFVSSYIYEKEVIKERHWKVDFEMGKPTETQESEIKRNVQERHIRTLWRFFRDNPEFNDMMKYLENEDRVERLYQSFNILDTSIKEISDWVDFIRDENINHWMAGAISRENREHEGAPKHILPITLNMYYILTNHQNAIWNDFDRAKGIRGNMTPRMIEHKYVPLNLFTSQVESEMKKYMQESFIMDKTFKRYAGNIDYSVATVDVNETQYWRRPSEVSRSQNPEEKTFLEELYKYYEKFNPEYAEYKKQGLSRRIEISQVFMTRGEFIEEYRRFGGRMRDKLKPSPLDGIKMKLIEGVDENGAWKYAEDKNGKPIIRSLGQIKEMIIINNMNDDEKAEFLGPKWRHLLLKIPGTVKVWGKANSGILNAHIKQADSIFRRGGDDLNLPEAIQRARKTIPIVGRGRTLFKTKKFVEAESTAIDSMIRAHYMKRLMAPLDWMLQEYATHGIKDGPMRMISGYLKTWGEYQLYNIKPEDQLIFGGQTISDLVDFGNRMNSLNKIIFSPKTQLNNLAIGQTLNLVREPTAVMRGLKRLTEGGRFIHNTRKIAAILNRYGLANITHDALFDQLEKEYKILGVDIRDIETYGYMPMEFTEKVNQFVVFVGLMTEEEWNAYDEKAQIKPGMKFHKLTAWRRQLIESRVKDIHGDYGTLAAAPAWLTNLGKAGLQFRKWLPAMAWAQFAPYHLDRNLVVRSGILPTVHLFGKIIKYNVQHTAEKQKRHAAKIKELAEKGETSSKVFFDRTEDYFQNLINEVNGGRISIRKDLSPSDKRNLVSALGQVVLLVAQTMASMLVFGGDDEKAYKNFARRNFALFFKRYSGDVFFLYSQENWQYFMENMIPALSLIADGLQFSMDIGRALVSTIDPSVQEKARYQKDTYLAKQGTPKFFISSTYILPAGSFIRWMQMKRRIHAMKNNYINLQEIGLTQDQLDMIGLNDFEISEFEIRENSYKYKRVLRDMNYAALYYELQTQGIDPGVYLDAQIGKNLLEAEADMIEDALKMITLQRMLDEGQLEMTSKQIREGAKKWRELQGARKADTKSKQKRKFEEAEEVLNK